METDKRWSQRLPFRHSVKFGQKNPPGTISFITDLSEGGICLQTNQVLTPGTKVNLSIAIEKTNYEAEGVVAWAEKAPPSLAHQIKGGMGIKFTQVDPELMEIYFDQLQQIDICVEAE